MSSNATRATDTPTDGDSATPATQSEAFPGLPNHVVIEHILGADTDPLVLAMLSAVSLAMHDTVAATGIEVEELTSERAAQLGHLDMLQH